MSRKRLYLLVLAILICTLAFAQHPNSRGGSPLYWALVGGLSYGVFYIIYILVVYLKNLLKSINNNEFNVKESFSIFISKMKKSPIPPTDCKKEIKTFTDEVPHIINDVEIHFCKYCGKKLTMMKE